jgi:hypothetical protein
MKTKWLILLISFFTITCKKEEPPIPTITTITTIPHVEDTIPHVEDNAFDESIFGNYTYYEERTNTGDTEQFCESAVEIEISNSQNNRVKFKEFWLPFKEEYNGIFIFDASWTSEDFYYTSSRILHYYPCFDSIAYFHVETSDGIPRLLVRGFGKKINGQSCPNGTPAQFEPLLCDKGPDNKYCYSSINTHKKNNSLGPTGDFNRLFIDSLDQTVQIGVNPGLISITLPTDSTFALLTGDYWIGEIPIEDKPIIGLHIRTSSSPGVSEGDIKEGHLIVRKSGDLYTISFNFICTENAQWTGYYNGEIN